MTARVFVHPRCLSGPAQCALEAGLMAGGVSLDDLCIGPATAHNHFEIVKVAAREGARLELERMDGTRFTHIERSGVAPEAA